MPRHKHSGAVSNMKCNTQNQYPWCELTREVQHLKIQAMRSCQTFHSAPQPNSPLHADAKTGHAFGIFMAGFCTLRPHGLRRR